MKVIINGKVEFDTRKEFIAEMKLSALLDNSDTFNVKNFLDACAYRIDRNGNIKIESGNMVIVSKKSKLFVNGVEAKGKWYGYTNKQ